MALVDERNQEDQSDGIEDSKEGSEKQVAGDTGVDDAEDEGSEEEKSDEEKSDEEESDDDEESDEDRQGFP